MQWQGGDFFKVYALANIIMFYLWLLHNNMKSCKSSNLIKCLCVLSAGSLILALMQMFFLFSCGAL